MVLPCTCRFYLLNMGRSKRIAQWLKKTLVFGKKRNNRYNGQMDPDLPYQQGFHEASHKDTSDTFSDISIGTYAPINIRPHYPPYGLEVGQGGDLHMNFAPRGGAYDYIENY